MQNAGIYHIAAQMTPNSAAVFPGALPLNPAGGYAPKPALSRATRSVSFLPTFRTASVVVFTLMFCFNGKKIVNFNMAAIGHLGLRFSWLLDNRRVPSAEWMLNTKLGSNWTNRFEVIKFLVNFSFFVGCHLVFWKITVLSLPLSVWRQGEAILSFNFPNILT